MIVLAIDTAGVDCSAAVFDSSGDVILSRATDRIGKGHAELLMAMIEAVLADAGKQLADLDRIAVTIGPGSFTGIRVGVAAARGLSLALGVPSVGITTLAALASTHRCDHPGNGVIAAMDARRDEIYAQAFEADGSAFAPPAIFDIDTFKAFVAQRAVPVAGTAAALLEGEVVPAEPDRFDIAVVARLGAAADPETSRPKPLYLRGPDAKPQDGFALARA